MPTRVGIYLRDTTGSSYGVPHIGNKPRVSATPYLYDIVKGNVAGHVALHKFGRNQAVGAADEIIWTPGGTGHYPYNATACPLNIVSTDLDDTGSGIGARTVSIEGLDAAGSSYIETITMNGDIPVLTTGSYLRVFRAKVLTAGASVENEGLINIRDIAGGSIMAQIDTGQNQAEMAMWTVPAGSTFYMVHLWASESATKTTRIILMARPQGRCSTTK